MQAPDVLDLARDALWTILEVSAPVMLVGLVVGVVISLIQTLTQIQEMTLTFVPKIIAIFASLLLFLPWMGTVLGDFMNRIAARIVAG